MIFSGDKIQRLTYGKNVTLKKETLQNTGYPPTRVKGTFEARG